MAAASAERGTGGAQDGGAWLGADRSWDQPIAIHKSTMRGLLSLELLDFVYLHGTQRDFRGRIQECETKKKSISVQ